MKRLLCTALALWFHSPLAVAAVPDPAHCTVSPIYGGPGSATEVVFIAPAECSDSYYTVIVRDSLDAPVPLAVVEFLFNSEIRICGTATTVADSSGVAQTYIRGGGCLTDVADACRILADGIQIRTVRGVRSVDNSAHQTSSPDLIVNTVDIAYFGEEFQGQFVQQPLCHDYNMDGACGMIDLTVFAVAFKSNYACSGR